MSQLHPEVQKALSALALLAPGKRAAKANEILKGTLTMEQLATAEGKELLHRRALFVTEARRRGLLWG